MTFFRKRNQKTIGLRTYILPLLIIVLIVLICVLFSNKTTNNASVFVVRKIQSILSPPGWIYSWDKDKSVVQSENDAIISFSDISDSFDMILKSGIYYRFKYDGTLLWTFDINDYSPYARAFDSDTIYIAGFSGHLYAIDKKNGKEKWRFEIPGLIRAESEPQLVGDRIYFGAKNGSLYALNKHTGELLWEFKTSPIDNSHVITGKMIVHFGFFGSDDSGIYINSATDNALYALDGVTGAIRWRFPVEFRYETIHIFQKSILVHSNTDTYYLLDKSNGKILYSVKIISDYLKIFKENIFLIKNNTIIKIDASSGLEQNSISNINETPLFFSVNEEYISLFTSDNSHTYLYAFDIVTEKYLWKSLINTNKTFTSTGDTNQIYIITENEICAYDMFSGQKNWCSQIQGTFATHLVFDGLYALTKVDNATQIYYLDNNTGKIMWRFSTNDINQYGIVIHKDNLLFPLLNKQQIIQLNRNSVIDNLTTEDLFLKKMSHLKSYRENVSQTIEISSKNQPIENNSVYELNIKYGDAPVSYNQDTLIINATFTSPSGKQYDTSGFYYNKNEWKIRFTPQEVGLWKWTVSAKSLYTNEKRSGKYEVIKSARQGFMQIIKNSRFFTTDQTTTFIPVGIEDCVRDYNEDGNYLDQWLPGLDEKPPLDMAFAPVTTMEQYLSLYSKSGFNLWRWGSGNCSYSLWRELSLSGNRYPLNENVSTDILFTELKNQGYHIWMSLFSFSLPFNTNLSIKDQKTILKDYINYVVARYAAYVDIWELTNEISLPDWMITFMAQHIKSIDPYNHPVTTNWERPNIESIDLLSVHEWTQECVDGCIKTLEQKTLSRQLIYAKPLVYSETGNTKDNWYELSAERMRVNLWVSFFNKAFLIYWNTSGAMYSKDGSSNIFLGPTERQYVSVFSNLIGDNLTILNVHRTTSTTDKDAAYSFKTNKGIIGYIYHKEDAILNQTSIINIDKPQHSLIEWYNPVTGKLIQKTILSDINETIETPVYKRDIVFKIINQSGD